MEAQLSSLLTDRQTDRGLGEKLHPPSSVLPRPPLPRLDHPPAPAGWMHMHKCIQADTTKHWLLLFDWICKMYLFYFISLLVTPLTGL